MTTTLSRPARQDVRVRVLDAAARNFRERGYAAADLRTIARDAGFTKGAIYSNFGSKPELFCQVCLAHVDAQGESVAAAVEQVLSAPGRGDVVEPLARELASALEGDVDWQITLSEFRALARTDPQVGHAYASLMVTRSERITKVLARLAPMIPLGPEDLRTLATAILGLSNVMALEHATAPDVVDIDLITDVIRRSLKGLLS